MNRVPPEKIDRGFEYFSRRSKHRVTPKPEEPAPPVKEPAACVSQAEMDELKSQVLDMKQMYEALRLDFVRVHAAVTHIPRDLKHIWDKLDQLEEGRRGEDKWRNWHNEVSDSD